MEKNTGVHAADGVVIPDEIDFFNMVAELNRLCAEVEKTTLSRIWKEDSVSALEQRLYRPSFSRPKETTMARPGRIRCKLAHNTSHCRRC